MVMINKVSWAFQEHHKRRHERCSGRQMRSYVLRYDTVRIHRVDRTFKTDWLSKHTVTTDRR